MTKDGRPSRINDIRYFHPERSTYLKGHNDAVAFGRRLAWFLNGEGVSLGAYPSLYILFAESLKSGVVHITDDGGDWWQRYAHVGVPKNLLNMPDASELVMRGTIAAVKAIRPDLATLIEDSAQIVRTHGDELQFLLKSRQTKRYIVEISFNIAVWPQPSSLFVSVTDRSNGDYLAAAPIPMQIYSEAFHLAGAIKVTTTEAAILPNQSVGATLTSLRHGGPLVKAISDFLPSKRPVLSKLIKRRG